MLQFREEGVLVRSVVLDLVFGIDDIIAAALAFVTAAAQDLADGIALEDIT